ncbi:MAG: FtsL-like putative cell division protein [Prevotella sp.]|nr:FtsL-like putative cell division protein [Prevotella sp.]
MLKNSVSEDDPKPSPTLTLTLTKIIGGEIFSNDIVRRQIWLILLIVLFTIVYVAFRYQCQQDMITIDKLETELKDAKYRALSSSSTLTERCRESHVLEILKNNRDSLLHVAEQPPYIIEVPEQ